MLRRRAAPRRAAPDVRRLDLLFGAAVSALVLAGCGGTSAGLDLPPGSSDAATEDGAAADARAAADDAGRESDGGSSSDGSGGDSAASKEPDSGSAVGDASLADGSVGDGGSSAMDGGEEGSTNVSDAAGDGTLTDGGAPSADGATDARPDGATDGASPAACLHAFSLPDDGYGTVVVNTDYDQWASPISLTKSGSTWVVSTPVPAGVDVQYKFVADGTWLVNPALPVIDLPSISNGMNTNNFLQGVVCGVPAPGSLQLVGGAVTTSASSYSFQVRFVPGAAPLDASKTVVTLNGAAVAPSSIPYDASTGTFTISVSSGVAAPNKYDYLFQVVDQDGAPARLFVPFWMETTAFQWTDAFIYEVMVDRFLAGGTSLAGPNGPPTDPVGDWKGGDFGGVTQEIESGYFDAMGVNTLWIGSVDLDSRLCEMGTSPNEGHCLSAYHSYFPVSVGWTYGSDGDPAFAHAGVTTPIEPHFGTAADLDALVNAAHRRGIRVLADVVVNHVFGDSSPPSGQAPQLGALWSAHQADPAWFNIPYASGVNDCGNENLWDTPASSATWNREDCWLYPFLSDLNSTSPTVEDAIANHVVWLMEQFGLDGFRIDAVKQVNRGLCADLRSKITAAVSTGLPVYLVGEALGSVVANVMDCVGDEALNGATDDPMHNAIISTILQTDGNAGSDLESAVEADESTWTGVAPSALMGRFFGSHDTPRAISLANGDDTEDPWTNPPPLQETNPVAFERLELAQAFLLTYDSIPTLWMGDEFGQPGAVDPDSRRMMRFGTALSALEQSTLGNLQTLGKLRAAHSSLRDGVRTTLFVGSTLYVYARTDSAGDAVIAALNLGTSAITQAVPVSSLGFTGTWTDALSGSTAAVASGTLTLTLAPLTAAAFTR